jgi:hypothetical protein
MKHIKLFENFGDEPPFSITVAPTEEFKRRLKEMKNSNGDESYLTGQEFRLVRNIRNEYNIVKIAKTPYEYTPNDFDGKKFFGKEDEHWISYDPKNSQVYVYTSRIFGNEIQMDVAEINSFDRRYVMPDEYRKFGLVWIGGYQCEFRNGFEVGMEDHRGYFKITKVEPFS